MSTVITSSIVDDIGGFLVLKDYVVGGYGISKVEGKKSCISILETKQERFQEQSGNNVLYLAKQAVKKDLDSVYAGSFAPIVSLLQVLPNVTTVDYIFVYAEGYTDSKKIVSSMSYIVNQSINWECNLNIITDQVYEDLLAQMSIQTSDMDTFGVDFISFGFL